MGNGFAYLVELEPYDQGSSTRKILRFSSHDDERVTGLNNEAWWPGVISRPTLGKEGWDGNFTGTAQIASAALAFDPIALSKNDPAGPTYRWPGAPVRIWEGLPGLDWSGFRQILAGIVEDYSVDAAGQYHFTAKVDGEPFEASLLALTYAGTGGAEGGDDLKDKVKPMLFGYAKNVEPVLIDAVNNVYQVHGYGPIEEVTRVYERAASFTGNGGSYVGDFADYAALVAANIKEGSYGSALAVGMFRLGAPAAGLITADVKGDNTGGFHQSTPAIIQRMCDIASVDSSRIDSASLSAFAATTPAGHDKTFDEMPIDVYLAEPTKLIDVIQQLALPCNAQSMISWTGQLQICRFGAIPSATIRFDHHGREMPPVLSIEEIKTSPPYSHIEMQGNRCWRVQGKDEIAFDDPIVPITVYKRLASIPVPPVGNNIPVGWAKEPTDYEQSEVGYRRSWGPVWSSNANQSVRGVTDDSGWSLPVLTDSDAQGWVIKTNSTLGKAFGATRKIKAASDLDPQPTTSTSLHGQAFNETLGFYIDKLINGPCRLAFRVRNAGDRVAAGFIHYDPNTSLGDDQQILTNTGGWMNTGIWIAQNDNNIVFSTEFVSPSNLYHPVTGVFPFTNYDPDGNYLDGADNLATDTPLAGALYELIYNGDTVDTYINGLKVRSYYINPSWDGDDRWPVFMLASPDAEIYDIVWERSTQATVVEFPFNEQFGAMRRMLDKPGWEMYAPHLTDGFGAGWIYSRDFKGGGRFEATIQSTSGLDASSYMILGTRGQIRFNGDGTYVTTITGTTSSGTWTAGDTFVIQYTGKRTRMYKNGVQIRKKKVGTGATVQAYLEFGANGGFYNLKVTPLDEEEFQNKAMVTNGLPVTPITQASPTVTGGYINVLETTNLVVNPPDNDDLVVSARLIYTNDSGSAVNFTPDAKIQYSWDNGGSWSDLGATQTPSSAPAAAPGSAQTITFSYTQSISSQGNWKFRLLVKNSIAGNYSVTLGGFLTAEWQG